jgi:hypothetical protein
MRNQLFYTPGLNLNNFLRRGIALGFVFMYKYGGLQRAHCYVTTNLIWLWAKEWPPGHQAAFTLSFSFDQSTGCKPNSSHAQTVRVKKVFYFICVFFPLFLVFLFWRIPSVRKSSVEFELLATTELQFSYRNLVSQWTFLKTSSSTLKSFLSILYPIRCLATNG